MDADQLRRRFLSVDVESSLSSIDFIAGDGCQGHVHADGHCNRSCAANFLVLSIRGLRAVGGRSRVTVGGLVNGRGRSAREIKRMNTCVV